MRAAAERLAAALSDRYHPEHEIGAGPERCNLAAAAPAQACV